MGSAMANDPLNLNASAEWAGLWWLPDDPDYRVPGFLRYEPGNGLTLSLIGTFEERLMTTLAPGLVAVHEGQQTWEVIHGAAEQREITLLDCIPNGGTRTIAARVKSPDKQTVVATIAIIGAHVSGNNDEAFAAAEVSVEDLGLWSASSVFKALLGTPGGKPDGSGSISVNRITDQVVVVEGTEYRLSHRYTVPYFDQRKGSTVGRMRDTVFARIVPAEAFSLRDALKAASLMQDLVALAMHRAAGVIWLRLEVAETNAELRGSRPVLPRNADVLYSPAALGKHDAKVVDQHRVFFTCASIPFE